MKGEPLKVLLVDDHQDFLDTLAYYLAKFPSVKVLAKARSGEDALKRVQSKPPDLVLMDLMLAGMNGCEVTRRIKSLPQPPRVIIVTLFNNAEYNANAQESGADGFLGKSEITAKLFSLIQSLFPDRKFA
jgi:DNA-binding NarL/FixJ family response regulator